MPVSVQLENDGIGVLITGRGNTEANEFIRINEEIYVPEIMVKLRYQLVDLTGIDQVDTSIEKIRFIAEADRAAAELIPGLKIAIVVNQGILESFAQIYTRLASNDDLITRIFNNITDARQWISDCIQLDVSA